MKIQKAYTIEESVYNAFDSLTNERNINKSSFIEDNIKKFLTDNDMDYVDKLYSLISNPNHIVTVTSQDTTYYYLSDGSKIQKILFMQIFKECEAVNPTDFFNKNTSIFENLAEKIKTIDESKVEDYPKSSHNSFESILNTMDNKYKENKDKKEEKEEDFLHKLYCESLNEINDNYNSGKYAIKSKIEVCEDIIRLMGLNFKYNEKEYHLKNSLLRKMTYFKNSLV